MSEEFYKAMDSNQHAVYVVEVYSGTERQSLGIFSTMEKAQAWMDTWGFSCVCCPYVIDEPDFGNVRSS